MASPGRGASERGFPFQVFGGGAPQEAPGLPVDPGTYKVVVSIGRNLSDSTMLVVNDDPYAPTSKEVRDAIRKANARLDKTTEKLNTLNERMTEADGIIAKIEANLKDMDNLIFNPNRDA